MKATAYITTVFLLLSLQAVFADDSLRERNDAIIVRAIQRMPNYDYSKQTHVLQAISRHLDRISGTDEYLSLAKQFRPDGMEDQLELLLFGKHSDSVKVDSTRLMLSTSTGKDRIHQLTRAENAEKASQITSVLGILGSDTARAMLTEIVLESDLAFDVRKTAIAGLAKNGTGQNSILQMETDSTLPADMRLFAGGLLARSNNEKVRERSSKLLPQPQQKNAAPLAPVDQLASMRGNAESGKKLFIGVATCANCHIVNQQGKDVGPDLSEIGTKLSKEAMYTAILDPSAGISHNYENYTVLTVDGQLMNGLKISETETEFVLRTVEAIDKRISKDDIEEIKKSEKSIMPENLHHTFDQQGLVDIVEYMVSLTKK
ncbi:c-type cytochrome [Rhodopirellula sp.]|nr:c-type cytochrome [Rhodopirellula sp.]MDB4678872.1 c-type cytochrome [Rhodopirellula sp.]